MYFYFNDTATTEIFTLSLHDALPILAFLGTLRDKVGQGNSALSADGALDGTFQVTLGAGSGARTVTRLELRQDSGSGGGWGTHPPADRKSVGGGKRVDLGGRRITEKKREHEQVGRGGVFRVGV